MFNKCSIVIKHLLNIDVLSYCYYIYIVIMVIININGNNDTSNIIIIVINVIIYWILVSYYIAVAFFYE